MSAASLWTKHRPMALGIANEWHLPGSDRDDVRQEALIALWIAARNWDPSRGPFRPFAKLVVTRRLTSLLRAATREGARVLTDAERNPVLDGVGGPDPERVVIDRERFRRVVAGCAALTELEYQAVRDLIDGVPQTKQSENARARARQKLARAV